MSANGYNPNQIYNNQVYPNNYAYQNPYAYGNPYQTNYPYMPQQQRLQSLEMQNPQYGQTVAPPIQNQPIQQQDMSVVSNNQINAIIVNSEDEARKYMPDMTGSIQLFALKDGNKIMRYFTKQIDDNLNVDFNIYEKVEKKIEKVDIPIVEEEKSDLLISIQNNIQSLDNKIDDLKTLDGKISELKSIYNKIDDLNIEMSAIKEALRDEFSTKQEHDKPSPSKSTRSSTSGK